MDLFSLLRVSLKTDGESNVVSEKTGQWNKSTGPVSILPSPAKGVAAGTTLLLQRLEFLGELVSVGEIAVNAGEADVGHFIDLAQFGEDNLADLAAGHFFLAQGHCLGFDGSDEIVQLIFAYGTFGEADPQAVTEFGGVELLATAVLLHHHHSGGFHTLVGGEPPVAGDALATTANRVARVDIAAINHAGVIGAAERTFH